MKFLIDTNILSEVVKPKPNHGVVKWLGNQDAEDLYVSVITLGELQTGIKRLTGARKTHLEHWFNIELLAWFGERIVPIDLKVMNAWSTLTAEQKDQGRLLPPFDSLIAATALSHQLQLVTRNEKDFKGLIDYINPFS